MKLNIAGLKIDSLSKQQLLDLMLERIKAKQKTWVTTVYSEFLYAGLKNPTIMEMLNKADIAIPDGIGIFWAARYLSIPLTAKNYWLKTLQAFWQAKYSLLAMLFKPSWIKKVFPEKIVGADLIWDIAKLANDNNLSIYLLGGFGNTPHIVSSKLKVQSSKLKIAGCSNKNPDDISLMNDINQCKPDILLVAYGPIKQEKWIYENLSKLPSVKLTMGIGGTFDYIAGKHPSPPVWIRKIGLEWLWRLFTQPRRIIRIFNATFGLVSEVILCKIFQNLPYRENVVSIIIKNKKLVFIVQRNPENKKTYAKKEEKNKYLNYWQLPQGGIGNDELVTAAKREVEEEAGIKNIRAIEVSDSTNNYNFSPTWKRLFDKEYRYKGQSQHIVYFEFSGNDSEIHLDQDELINWRWVDINNLENSVHPERLPLAKIVMRDLKEMWQKGII